MKDIDMNSFSYHWFWCTSKILNNFFIMRINFGIYDISCHSFIVNLSLKYIKKKFLWGILSLEKGYILNWHRHSIFYSWHMIIRLSLRHAHVRRKILLFLSLFKPFPLIILFRTLLCQKLRWTKSKEWSCWKTRWKFGNSRYVWVCSIKIFH